MSDKNNCGVILATELKQQLNKRIPMLGVECRGWFIRYKKLRSTQLGACRGNTLLLTNTQSMSRLLNLCGI